MLVSNEAEDIPGEETESSKIDDRDDSGAGEAVVEEHGVELDFPLNLRLGVGDGVFEGIVLTNAGDGVLEVFVTSKQVTLVRL